MNISSAKTEIKPTFNKVTFNEFESQLAVYKDKLNNIDTIESLKKLIVSNFTDLVSLYINMGNYVEDASHNNETEVDVIETYIVNYSVPEDFKTTIILHRDVFLELNKVKVLEKEQKEIKTLSNKHFEKSKAILESQLDDVLNKIFAKKNALSKNLKASNKLSKKLSLHQNPWSVYNNQFTALLSQFKDIEQAKDISEDVLKTFNDLKKACNSISDKHTVLIKQLEANISHIEKNINNKDAQKELKFFIDEQLVHDLTLGNNLSTLTEDLNSQIDKLKRVKIPISSEQGMLINREVDLNKAVQKWFDYQILPDVMDLITIENSLKSINSINLTNLKNNIQLAKSSDEENTNRNTPNLNNLKDSLSDLKSKGEVITARVNKKVEAQLQIANLIKGKVFLEVPFNSSLNLNSNTFLNSIKSPIQKGLSFFDTQIKKTTHYNAHSSIESATHCLNHRMFKQDDEHYDSLFLNKKFIGDLFLIPRKTQEETLSKTLNQWHSGFNKSALVFGERLSGRSTFLDYTSKKYFGNNIVVLQPNSVATIDGRKFTTTNNLKEALQYIKNNNNGSTKPVILIDDLELWRDKDYSLLSNIRALINFIETESDVAFVMVSTTKAMVNHLDARLNFSNVFSTSINVSKTDRDEIIEALMIRHGAAHRDLVSENLEPMSAKMIQKAITKLSHKYNNNLGDVFQAWTYYTFVQENEKVLFKEVDYDFPDFFTQQELIILKQSSIFKKVTELELKRILVSRFESDFKSALKRLINTKVLLRNNLGHLYINPVVLSDVNQFINQRN